MPNYSNTYGVGEVSRMLKSDRDTIKTLAYTFRDYCSSDANPEKGQSRQFTLDDILVLQFALCHWEDQPDIENIKIGLNREEHLEEPYINIITDIKPIFREVQEIDAFTRIPMLGGMNGLNSFFELATSYKNAGDYLLERAVDGIEEYEMLYPILFNYRHSLELFFKAIIAKEKQTHNFHGLYEAFKYILKFELKYTDIPIWFDDLVNTLIDFDPNGETFRYGEEIARQEFVVELTVLRDKMDRVEEAFLNIKHELVKERSVT